ncbi:MAG: VOC family protein [Chitinophagaceae bacterium]|nr:VOC family protein [Chitinophagaceae bacterium]
MSNKLQHLSPILWTKNLDETISFYVDVLGFKTRSNFPGFASLYRDDVELMMIVPTLEEGEEFPKASLTGSIYIFTENVDDLWGQVKDRAMVKSAIADRQYLMRDFSIFDNNGYELAFGQDISGA